MNPRNFFSELQRRNVYKVAVAYGIVAWLLIQIATQTFPFFGVPSWVVRAVILILALGFPVALVFAWAFELTPEGLKRTKEISLATSTRAQNRPKARCVHHRRACFASSGPSLPAIQAKQPPSNRYKSIAVPPIRNFSDDQENAFLRRTDSGRYFDEPVKIAT